MQPGSSNVPQSEDCLYLNIWGLEGASQSLPVFVWIHGGGFTSGYSFDPLFDGSEFARDGVICVTIAYRLGVFGFLDMSPLLGESYAGSANLALMDVIEALRWVQANIASFGGDPKRVTVGGESAGAKITDLLMGVPGVEPLFRQMISESGGAERIWPILRAEEIAHDFGAQWTKDGRELVTLRNAPALEIIDAQAAFIEESPVHFPLRTEIDGSLIKRSPLESIRNGSTRGKRLLLGTNLDESAFFLGPDPKADPTARDLGNLTVGQFRTIEERYRQIYPAMTDEMRRIRSVTAEEYWIPSLRVAEAHVERGGTAFVYRMDYAEKRGRLAGLAFHSEDLRFVWDHLSSTATDEDRQFARTVHEVWVSFLKGQAPQAAGLPMWPDYSKKRRPTMVFDRTSHVEDAPQAEEFAAWDGLLTH
jgi:para-nitrobenzyl esterase